MLAISLRAEFSRCLLERVDDGSAPFGGADVAGVAREEPMVAFEIEYGVLAFAIDSFVEVFDDLGSGGLGVGVVRVDIFDEYREALRDRS
jgi:hypothetical protein